MKLIVTRHGKTFANEKGILQGQSVDGELSEVGVKQTEKIAQRLKDEKIDRIYASPLKRAYNTALAIQKYHPDIKVEVSNDIKEVNLGDFEGKPHAKVNWDEKPANAESREEVYARAKRFMEKIFEENKDKTVLVVAHSGINKSILKYLLKTNPQEHCYIHQDNTSINIFELEEDGNHRAKLINCTKHLD